MTVEKGVLSTLPAYFISAQEKAQHAFFAYMLNISYPSTRILLRDTYDQDTGTDGKRLTFNPCFKSDKYTSDGVLGKMALTTLR